MPDNPAGQFPLPADTPTAPREVPLTDEVAPNLSTPPAPRSEAEIPSISEGQPTPPPATPLPVAAVPNRPFPIVIILLLLVSIGAVAAAYFFYQQNQSLNRQLTEIERIQEQQRTRENQAIITPTSSPTIEISPTGTVSATPTPTASPTPAAGKAFDQIDAVLAAAAKYPAAQLLMITATGLENPATAITKYWFRQTASDKRYLYVLAEPGKDLALVDQQVYVTPDDNIPSLNDPAKNGQLGIDLDQVLTIASAACPPNFSCAFTPTSGQFIKAGVTLWQISYKPTDGSKPFVIQIDSTTKKILYKNQ